MLFNHRPTGDLTRRLFIVKNKYFDNHYFSLKIFNFFTVFVSFGGKHHFVPKNDDFRNFAKNRDKQCLSFSLTTVQPPAGQNTYFWQNDDFSRRKKMLKYCHFVGLNLLYNDFLLKKKEKKRKNIIVCHVGYDTYVFIEIMCFFSETLKVLLSNI